MAQFLYALTLSDINLFSKLFYCQNQEKICNDAISKDPITPQVCCYTTLWSVTEWGKTVAAFYWSRHWSLASPVLMRRPVAKQAHWTFDVKLQDVTVTLDNNWNTKHGASCC